MENFFIMLKNVILFVLLAIPGFLMVKTGRLKAEHSAVLSRILMFVGLPFLVLSGTASISLSGEFLLLSGVMALGGAIYTVLFFLLSKPLTAGEENATVRGMMRFCTTFSNNGFLGIPLVAAVFGTQSKVFSLIVVLNVITNLLMYSLGASVAGGEGKRTGGWQKSLLNPVFLAFLMGLVLNLCKIPSRIPEVNTYTEYFSNLVTPVSMTILGMKMATCRFSTLFSAKSTFYVSFLKLILMPVGITGLLLALRGVGLSLDEDLMNTALIGFSMPTAGLASTFADEYGGDSEGATRFVLGTTLLSILTIPVLYHLLTLFL